MFEHRKTKPISRRDFAYRILRYGILSVTMASAALGVGVLGYHYIGGLGWVDSLLNASMILGGMGPVDVLQSDAAKVFASLYALFSGLVFIGVAGLLTAPFVHRLLHHFHWDEPSE